MRMLGLKSGPLQKQCVLLTAEPPPQPGTLLFDTDFVKSLGRRNAQVSSEHLKEYILKSIYASAHVPVEDHRCSASWASFYTEATFVCTKSLR